ncbi:MAG: PEP/pyruvate-binding domain-containing protein, partial [Candidatus Aenigmatarchaeota archaeon]
MEFVAWFEQLDKNSLSLAGGKGANLGELTKIKMPVPPGFVITTKAFDKFIELNGIKNQIQELIEACDVDNTEQLLETSKKIKSLIISQDFPIGMRTELIDAYRELSFAEEIITPKALELIAAGRDYALVAVRSSATAEDLPTASFAGQQATFLNVKGIKDYLESVKKCWASLYEPRAIFYRAKNNIKHASIAVVVQRMVSSDASGVMFTVNPTTGEDEIVIEATWGLGETLVAGEVEPDFYRVSKDGRILEKKIGKKEKMRVRDLATDRTVVLPVAEKKVNAQVLSDEQILQLAEYGKAIEKHYGKSQDIEFAVERGRIFIVQARAVTAIGKKEEVKIEGEILLKGLAVSPGIASGKVKIVHSMQDITKVEKGDILVTEMTSPDLVPTMSKCAAIITDAGGQTSHAAIVS